MGEDHISFNYSGFDMGNVVGYNTGAIDSIDFKPKPDLKGPSHHKYQEDKGIKDLQDYVSSTTRDIIQMRIQILKLLILFTL